LKLFYSDPKKYGFAFQWGMLKTRQYQLQMAHFHANYSESNAKKFYFWDRSMLGDYMFALWNHLLGGISREEMNVYESEFGGSFNNLKDIPFLKDISCFVLLNDEPYQCKWRVEQARKNPSEQGIPLPYYEGIDDMHFNIFLKILVDKIGRVLVLNWGNYHDPQHTLSLIESIIQGQIQPCSAAIVRLEHVPRKAVPRGAYVYFYEEDVMETYRSINENSEKLEELKKCHTIYMPMNIMTVSRKEKNVSLDHEYKIQLYKNEYKRVTLWHLAHFHKINFFSTK